MLKIHRMQKKKQFYMVLKNGKEIGQYIIIKTNCEEAVKALPYPQRADFRHVIAEFVS